MSNSSSLSSYSTFSSSSSKPGAKAAQLSGDDVCQTCTSPDVVIDAMIGLVGCHWSSGQTPACIFAAKHIALTVQAIRGSLGPSSTLTKTPLSLSQINTLCAILCAAPPITYSASPENPIEFQGVRLIRSWKRWRGLNERVRGSIWSKRSARSVAEVKRWLCPL